MGTLPSVCTDRDWSALFGGIPTSMIFAISSWSTLFPPVCTAVPVVFVYCRSLHSRAPRRASPRAIFFRTPSSLFSFMCLCLYTGCPPYCGRTTVFAAGCVMVIACAPLLRLRLLTKPLRHVRICNLPCAGSLGDFASELEAVWGAANGGASR